ncbi:hypothetical protein HMPREF1860_01265 [Prevotella amnii]|uniref:Uncharacterized protein n=1 Tax=Prevotella amnii TaxID=419005 RepID=A0A134BCW5_9BACT|nr:hypothetical protein HMPREF1860_01265 [Prevotella amnii]
MSDFIIVCYTKLYFSSSKDSYKYYISQHLTVLFFIYLYTYN